MTGKNKFGKDDATAASSAQVRRRQAEARMLKKAALSPENIETLSPEATRQLLHELRVHQIELEMQNEELRESQAALAVVQARYFDLYDLAPVGYCTVSEQGMIVQANLTAASLLGVARGALVNKPLSQFIARADQDPYYLHRRKLLETGEPQSCELRMVKNGGTQFWAHLAVTAAQDAGGGPELRVVLSDISERKRTELAAARLATIVNSSDDAVISQDLRGIVISWNHGAEKIFGYPASEIIGKSIALLIPPEHQEEESEILGRIVRGASVQHFDTVRRKKDGSIIDVDITVSPIRDEAGSIVGASKVARDVTERKWLDRMLQENNAALERARSAADKANRAKSEFLSSMSHELRTPLNAILGFTQLIESSSPSPTPAQQRSIDQILKAGWYLLTLINEILDLALIESGKLSLIMEPVSLIEVVDECKSLIELQAKQHDISLAFSPIKIPCLVSGSHTRIKQCLINLLSNAIKYNKAGGTVTVSCIASGPGRIRICVEDTGAGLTAAKLMQLFEPFNRLGNEAGAQEGTGIGLVMTKRLVEMMGGAIGVDSTVGVGSVFWIELDLAAEPQPAAVADTPTAVAQVETDAKLHTLLYVEDNLANLMLVEEIIARRPDIRLLNAFDGIRAVDMARESLPDVILMDVALPGISGVHALGLLREDPATAHIPVIALSANAMPHDIEMGLEAGFFRYLTKPIKVNEFMDTLDSVLKHAATQAARNAKQERT